MNELTQTHNGLPEICGPEKTVVEIMRTDGKHSTASTQSSIDFSRIRSGFAIALHMHQPLIPAGGPDLKTAEIVSNLQDMMDHQNIGDNHNAQVFHWCYKRMSEFIPALIEEGKQPRVMLDYSGTLLHGLQKMGLRDVFDACGELPARRGTLRRWNGWVARGAMGLRLQHLRRIIACMSGHGSTILRRSLASRRWAACAAFLRRRWPCLIIRILPMSSSRRSRTAATVGCWSRNTPSSGRRLALGRSESTCRTG